MAASPTCLCVYFLFVAIVHRNLFFASTPLHIILSTAVALREGGSSVLVCIDQPSHQPNPYLGLLDTWPDNPFVSTHNLPRHTNVWNKIATRKANFALLDAIVDKHQPTHVFTGSDRRIEFQYAAARASKLFGASGIYLDEGTFSYITRSASQTLSDRVFDNALKKIFYGRWWCHPPTTGASCWIDECRLFFPQHANPWLLQKNCIPLEPTLLTTPQMQEWFRAIVRAQGFDNHKLEAATHLLTLPHHSLSTEHNYALVIKRLQQQQAKIIIKYHPRSKPQDYPAMLGITPWYEISGPCLLEALLATVPASVALIGDLSSTLLVGRWLYPNRHITALHQPSRPLSAYQQFLHTIGVRLESADSIGSF